jgi:hypothetical protein
MRGAALVGLALVVGCGQSRPPEACEDGGLPTGPWFVDASEEIGLRAVATDGGERSVDGNRLSIVDLDGDGWPDLSVGRGRNGRRDAFGDLDAVREHFVLRNDAGSVVDVTEASGLGQTRDGVQGRAWNFAVWGDVDNDGDVDAITVVHEIDASDDHPDPGDRTEVLLNDGAGNFTLAEASDLQANLWKSTSATLLDADRDGWLDLFVGNQYGTFGNAATSQQDRLLQGMADGRFRDRTAERGLAAESGGGPSVAAAPNYVADDGANVHWATFGTVACDVDDDGDPDLLTQSYGRGLNQLWINDGGSFTNQTAAWGWSRDDEVGGDDFSGDERFRCWCAGAGAIDPVCDGIPAPRIACNGGWTPGWDDQPHRLGGNTFSATCADFDGDGDLDVATGEIRHWWTPTASDPSTIAWNEGGRFERRDRAEVGLEMDWTGISGWNEGDLTVAAADVDHDGWVDLLRPQSDYADTWFRLFHNDGDGTFTELAPRDGIDMPRASGIALADWDRDGDLDVFTSFSRMRCDEDCPYPTPEVHFFRNVVGQDRNRLQIELEGAGVMNRDALGATVRVTAGGRTQVAELRAGEGHQGVQHERLLSFGLGETCRVERVEVRWPDAEGTTEVWEDLPANWRVRLTHGEATPAWPDWEP